MLKRHLRRGTGVRSLLGPPALELERDRVRVGEGWLATFAVVSYPSEVARGWLATAARAARRRRRAARRADRPSSPPSDCAASARLESTRRLERERGLLPDPFVAAAAEDVEELAAGSLAVRAASSEAASTCRCVPAAARSWTSARSGCGRSALACHTVPASFRPFEGWLDAAARARPAAAAPSAFDTGALAASFLFAAADPPAEDGVLYGSPEAAPDPARPLRARELQQCPARRSGAARATWPSWRRCACSTAAQVFVIDPEDEYRRLCEAVGGIYLPLAARRRPRSTRSTCPRAVSRTRSRHAGSSSPS